MGGGGGVRREFVKLNSLCLFDQGSEYGIQ